MTKVLVGIPYHTHKAYALPHVLEWIDTQTYKDTEVIMRWHTGPYGEKNAVKDQFESFRRIVLNTPELTHLYILEADTIPPIDTLPRLLSHGKDVVSGLYYYRDGEGNPVAWGNKDSSGLVEIDGAGMGSLLLSRKALEAASWYDFDQQDADWPYFEALKAKGITAWLDCSVVCKHYADAKTWY